MNARELRELLEDLPDEVEVRMVHQPAWPLQTTISKGVYVGCDEERIEELEEILESWEDADGEAEQAELANELEQLRSDGNQTGILWLAEGSHPWDESPYPPGVVTQRLEWGRSR